ncbi:MAG: hypothetical protein U9O94_09965 [Nanoarchaeota archaeon]|nr:hypothetical protein [Nanoarchaeota archaeon]
MVKLDNKDFVEIRLSRAQLRWIERLIFIVIILVLIGLLFYNPFSQTKCIQTSEIVSVPVATETEDSVVEVELEEEPEPEEEVELEEEPEPEAEEELTGEATLSIGEIGLSEDKKRIEYVWVYIDNDKGLFTPKIRMYWYGPGTTAAVKNSVKYEYTWVSLISTGKTNKKFDDEVGTGSNKVDLQGRYLNLDEGDNKCTFVVELYDAKDDELLYTKSKTVLVD